MKPKKRQKLCYNCEGEVDLDVIFCPFCGTDLLEEKSEEEKPSEVQNDPFRTLSAHESNSSLYPPPYSPESAAAEEEVIDEEEMEKKVSNPFLPLLLLTVGGWFSALAILLFVFSENGFVVLKFDAKMWLIYLLLSVPFFFVGTKLLKKVDG